MKMHLFAGLLVLPLLPSYSYAQEAGSPPKTLSALVVKVNNLFHFSKKPLNTYYALGGEAGLYIRDKWYIGLAQYSSLSPADLWKNNPYRPDKIRVYEYSVQVAYRYNVQPSVYLYTGVRVGYGAMHMEYRYNNGVDNNETMTRESMGALFAAPDIRMGLKLNKFLSVEAGLNYRLYLGGQPKWGLSANNLNGLGGVVSLVGNIPL